MPLPAGSGDFRVQRGGGGDHGGVDLAGQFAVVDVASWVPPRGRSISTTAVSSARLDSCDDAAVVLSELPGADDGSDLRDLSFLVRLHDSWRYLVVRTL